MADDACLAHRWLLVGQSGEGQRVSPYCRPSVVALKHIIISGGRDESCDACRSRRGVAAGSRYRLTHLLRHAVSETQLRHLRLAFYHGRTIKRGFRTCNFCGWQRGDVRLQIVGFVAGTREEASDKQHATKSRQLLTGNSPQGYMTGVTPYYWYAFVISHSYPSIVLYPHQDFPAIASRQW